MKGGFRQSMAWLHTWCGLWLGWLLFAIFLTGALSVFHEPITHWMQPERITRTPAALDRPAALAHAQRYLEQHAAGASHWDIELPGDEDYAMHLHVAGQEGPEIRLDPATGEVLPPARDSDGGRHFITFHYELHGGMAGVWVVAFATMAMLVAMVSGIVTHRRFFRDFFTFRPGKGPRSWLDAHNVLGVLALPFLFAISYTGLIIWWPETMPAGIRVHYGGSEARFFSAVGRDGWLAPRAAPQPGAPAAMPPLAALLADADRRLASLSHGDDGIGRVSVSNPGRTNAEATFSGAYRHESLAFAAARELRYDAATGAFLAAHAEDEMLGAGGTGAPAAMVAGSVMRTLHMVRFGGLTLRWLYFVGGLSGAALIATGVLLFSLKRRARKPREFGGASLRVYGAIERLNVAAVAGLAAACAAFLWGNRLLPATLPERHEWEIAAFFAAWLAALAHACLCAPERAWPQQLATAALLCLLLPVLNAATTGWHLLRYAAHGDWRGAGVELGALGFGAMLLWAAARVRRKQAATIATATPLANGEPS
ncbi:PepSY-associated TM region [compost metagenome]